MRPCPIPAFCLVASSFALLMAADTPEAPIDAGVPLSAVAAIRESIERLHPGEPVQDWKPSGRVLPKRRDYDHPWVELRDLRATKINDRREIEFQCHVVERQLRDLFVVMRGEFGVLSRRVALSNKNDSTIRFEDPRSRDSSGMEIWAEYRDGWSPFVAAALPLGYKISPSVTLGAVQELSFPRHWSPVEQREFHDRRIPAAEPFAPPAGYQLVDREKLQPGMPILYFLRGTWSLGELLSDGPSPFRTVRMSAAESATTPAAPVPAPMIGRFADSQLAVVREIALVAENGPANSPFKPSVRILPGSLIPLPDHLWGIPAETKLQPGTRVYVEQGLRWVETLVRNVASDGKVQTVNDAYWEWDHKREALAIDQATLAELSHRDAETMFAQRWAEFDKKWAGERRKRAHVRDYLATFPLPEGFIPLGEKVLVKKGDRFKISYAHRWEDVTAVAESREGAVECHWDSYGDRRTWDQFISRKSLFIVPTPGKPTPHKDAAATSVETGRPKENGHFTLTLDNAGTRKIAVTKVVMKATGLDLRDAREAVEETPIILFQSLTQSAAVALQQEIEAAGGRASVTPTE